DPRIGSAAPAAAHLARALRRGDGAGRAKPRHLAARASGGRDDSLDRYPRPARRRAEDRAERRRRRLDVRALGAQDAARDRQAAYLTAFAAYLGSRCIVTRGEGGAAQGPPRLARPRGT